MRAFIGLLLVVSCGSVVLASQSESKDKQSESAKQEKRSLSHGVLGGGYPSNYGSLAGSYASYGLAGAYANGIGGLEGGVVSSGPVTVSGGPEIVSSGGPGIVSGFGGAGIGPGFAGGVGFAAGGVGVSTNTDTLTTVRQNIPVPVAVDRPVPV